MSRPLIVNNKTFNYPDPGEDVGWGQNASDWASEVTEVLNTILAPGDILATAFDINDNTTVPTNIQGLAFDSSLARSAKIVYSVYRTSTNTPSGNAETGEMDIIYDNGAPVNTKWKMTQNKNGDAGIVFSINDLGQFTYTTTQIDLGAGGYVGILKFSAKSTAI
jgi:hypothetical protein